MKTIYVVRRSTAVDRAACVLTFNPPNGSRVLAIIRCTDVHIRLGGTRINFNLMQKPQPPEEKPDDSQQDKPTAGPCDESGQQGTDAGQRDGSG